MATQRVATAELVFTGDDSRLKSTLQGIQGETQKTSETFKALNRVAQDVFGSSMEQRAKQIADAIEAVGGATRLTDSEAKTYLRTLDAWIEKSRRLGKDVAPGILATRDALAQSVTATQKAEQEVGKLGKAYDQAEKEAREFAAVVSKAGGADLQKQAQMSVAAIKQIGGATKLTDAEAKAHLATLDAWIAKARVLGQKVPDDILSTRAALAHVNTEATKTPGILSKIGGAATSMAGALGLAFSAGAVISFAKSVLATAGQIDDLSKKLGVSAEAVQKWKYAAEQGGATIDDVGRAVNVMNRNLAEGSTSTKSALKDAGLAFDEIRRKSPEDAFNAITDAIQKIPDPMIRARVAMELFGKGGAELLPAIVDGFADVAKGAAAMSNETIKRLADAEDAWGRFGNKIVIVSGEILAASMEMVGKATSNWTNFLKSLAAATPGGAMFAVDLAQQVEADRKAAAERDKTKGAKPDANVPPPTVMKDYVAELAKAKAEVAGLTKAQREGIAAAKDVGATTEQITTQYKISEAALRLLTSETKNNTKAGNEQAEIAKRIAAAKIPLTQAQKTEIDQLTKLGISHSDIAKKLKVSEIAVGRYADEQKRLNEILKEQIPLLPRTAPNLANLNLGAGLSPQLPMVGRSSLMGPLIDTLNDEMGRIKLDDTGLTRAAIDVAKRSGSAAGQATAVSWATRLKDQLPVIMKDASLGLVRQMSEALAYGIETGDWSQFTAALQDGLSTFLASSLAGAIDFFVPGLGTALQPLFKALSNKLIGGLAKLFGRGDDGDKERDAFLREMGGFAKLAAQLNAIGRGDLFRSLINANSGKDAEKAIKAINAALTATRDELQHIQQNGGLASRSLRQFLDATKDSAESVEFLKTQTRGAAAAIGDFLKSSNFRTQAGATAGTDLIAASFAKMREEGLSIRQVLTELAPVIKLTQEKLAAAGLSGSDAFNEIAGMANIAAGEITGPLLDGISALGRGLEAAHNSGLLTQSMFEGLTGEIVANRQALIDQGVSGAEASRLMHRELQTIWQLQKDFGYQVDASTQKLLDEAESSGVVGDKFRSAMDRAAIAMEKAANAIIRAFGGVATEAEKTGGRIDHAFRPRVVHVGYEVSDAPTVEPPDVGSEDPSYASRGGLMTARGITQYFDRGGPVRSLLGSIFQPRGIDTEPAMLAVGEGVLNRQAMSIVGGNTLQALNAGRMPMASAPASPAPTIHEGNVVIEKVEIQGNVDSDSRVEQIAIAVAKRIRRAGPALEAWKRDAMPALAPSLVGAR